MLSALFINEFDNLMKKQSYFDKMGVFRVNSIRGIQKWYYFKQYRMPSSLFMNEFDNLMKKQSYFDKNWYMGGNLNTEKSKMVLF